jgi:catechol 2,3-dioxygenase-like lactoylglutathione lyase family enzyme
MLQHVSVEVPPDQAEGTLEFWRLIGFERVDAPAALGDAVLWVEREGTQIHLILTEGHTAPLLGHAAVVVPDHAEAKRRLREAGFEVEDHRQLWGADRAFAKAPGGHLVELMAEPPPASR